MLRFWSKSLIGKKVNEAKLHRVIDGDTFQIYLPVCCFNYIFDCRLNGVDTPELHSKNKEEKKLAVDAKDYVESILTQNKFNVICGEFDKYGRILCDIEVIIQDKMIGLSDLLLTKKYANSYDGGKKKDYFNSL